VRDEFAAHSNRKKTLGALSPTTAAAQNEMGTASVPISVSNWPLALG